MYIVGADRNYLMLQILKKKGTKYERQRNDRFMWIMWRDRSSEWLISMVTDKLQTDQQMCVKKT